MEGKTTEERETRVCGGFPWDKKGLQHLESYTRLEGGKTRKGGRGKREGRGPCENVAAREANREERQGILHYI